MLLVFHNPPPSLLISLLRLLPERPVIVCHVPGLSPPFSSLPKFYHPCVQSLGSHAFHSRPTPCPCPHPQSCRLWEPSIPLPIAGYSSYDTGNGPTQT